MEGLKRAAAGLSIVGTLVGTGLTAAQFMREETPAHETVQATSRPVAGPSAEDVMWAEVEKDGTAESYQSFLDRFPGTDRAALAEARVKAIHSRQVAAMKRAHVTKACADYHQAKLDEVARKSRGWFGHRPKEEPKAPGAPDPLTAAVAQCVDLGGPPGYQPLNLQQDPPPPAAPAAPAHEASAAGPGPRPPSD